MLVVLIYVLGQKEKRRNYIFVYYYMQFTYISINIVICYSRLSIGFLASWL